MCCPYNLGHNKKERFFALWNCISAGRVAVDVDPYEYATTVAKKHAGFHAGKGGASIRYAGSHRAGRHGRRPLRIRNNGCEGACRIPRRESGVNPLRRCTQGGSSWASTPTNTQQRLRRGMPNSTQGRWCESVASVHAGRVAVDVDPYEYATTVAKKHAGFHAGEGGAKMDFRPSPMRAPSAV